MVETLSSEKTSRACVEKKTHPAPLIIILLGPPGSGKGTHAAPLSASLGLPHISTGETFRHHIRSGTPTGIKAQSYIDRGCLVPDACVLEMVFARLQEEECANGAILDGFPRTLAQAQAFDRLTTALSADLTALYFHIEERFLVERITGRVACKECGKPFHKQFEPPKTLGICDQCGGSLYQREDDTEEVLRRRLAIYRKDTEPLVAYFAQKNVLKEINAQQTKNKVFLNALKAVSKENTTQQ